ncbi:MAG: hypothetical protein OJF50_004792 [Nitrospira sp.]|nr:hypothetical protein [Nitrospira sp.]
MTHEQAEGLSSSTDLHDRPRWRIVFLIRSANTVATARLRESSTYFMTVIPCNLLARHLIKGRSE